ncbi:MAG TPA: hypothetical protein VF278_19890, partial [Pirellulales bacterium]
MPDPAADGELHPALAAALREDREALNQRFQVRQRLGANINVAGFQRHLRTTVNELICKVAVAQPERCRVVANALFDVSLDLFSAGLLGPQAKHRHMSAAWQDVLPPAVTLLARDPFRIAGCVSNAVACLASHPSGRPAQWIGMMGHLATDCDGVSQFLDAGKVAAWMAGLVQYRAAALGIARQLPQKVSARLLELPVDLAEDGFWRQLDRLDADRWYKPRGTDAKTAASSPRLVGTTGGFRGFGGPCLRPPTVVTQGDRLFVFDGDATWRLLADAYGVLWHRVAPLSTSGASRGESPGVVLDASGSVSWNGKKAHFADMADASSHACDGQTLAVTLPTSHYVFLVANT